MDDNIRKAELTDAHAIAEIYNYYIANTTVTYETETITAEEMERRIKEISEKYPYLVYEEDGKVVAYCYAHPWRTRAAFLHTLETSIYLSHTAKRHGIGTKLLTKLIDIIKQQGYHALIATITDENKESDAFHKRMGFRQVGQYEQVGWKFNRWIGLNCYEMIL